LATGDYQFRKFIYISLMDKSAKPASGSLEVNPYLIMEYIIVKYRIGIIEKSGIHPKENTDKHLLI